MASVLAQQLQNVGNALGPALAAKRYASVLYSEREAADTDTQTILGNALHGESHSGCETCMAV